MEVKIREIFFGGILERAWHWEQAFREAAGLLRPAAERADQHEFTLELADLEERGRLALATGSNNLDGFELGHLAHLFLELARRLDRIRNEQRLVHQPVLSLF